MNSKALDSALEKTAGLFGDMHRGMSTTMSGVRSGLASGNAKSVTEAATTMQSMGVNGAKVGTAMLIGAWGAKKVIENLMNDHTRKALLEDLVLNDSLISQADPEKVKGFYATIHHLAPKLSCDKNIVKELLQNFIKFDRVDINSIKTLADTQKSLSAGDSDLSKKLF